MSEAVIYLRRSVVDEDNPGTVSYDQQLARCRDLARLHTTAEPELLVDWGRSGGEGLEHRRGAYQQLRDRVRSGAVRWVVSYDLSRLSRSTRETLDLVELALRHGAKVHVGDLGILDPEDPTGKFTLTALSGANTLLRDMARKRAKEIVVSRRAKGLPIGRPPYGSQPGEDARAIVAAFHEAGSFHAAARLLNARGVQTRTGSPWAGKTVRAVVRRAEPLDVAARPRVRSRGRYTLTGLVWCHCGAPMRIIGTRWNVAAICGRGMADSSHPRPIQVSEAKLIPWVQAEAARLKLPEAVEDEIAADEGLRSKLAAKRSRIVDMFADGTIKKPERDRRLAAVDDELSALVVRSVVIKVPRLDWSWPPDEINGVLRAIFERIELGPDLLPFRAEWLVPEWRA